MLLRRRAEALRKALERHLGVPVTFDFCLTLDAVDFSCQGLGGLRFSGPEIMCRKPSQNARLATARLLEQKGEP